MVSAESPFAWHPTAALSRVYGVAGEQQDLWLVDGASHKILQHWQGTSLPLSPASSSACHTQLRWKFVVWSDDASKLFLQSKNLLVVFRFGVDPQKPELTCLTVIRRLARAAWAAKDIVANLLSEFK